MQAFKKSHMNLSQEAILVSWLLIEGDSETFEEVAYKAGISMKQLDILLEEISVRFSL